MLNFPGPLSTITKHSIKKSKGNSLPSIPTSDIFLELATIMVIPNKNADGLVSKPTAIKIAPIDSEKAAKKPKVILSESSPIHWVRVFPSRSHREESAVSFDQP